MGQKGMDTGLRRHDELYIIRTLYFIRHAGVGRYLHSIKDKFKARHTGGGRYPCSVKVEFKVHHTGECRYPHSVNMYLRLVMPANTAMDGR